MDQPHPLGVVPSEPAPTTSEPILSDVDAGSVPASTGPVKSHSPSGSKRLPISDFPEHLRDQLKVWDASGDGMLEFDDVVRAFTTLQTLQSGCIPFSAFPADAQGQLAKFDDSGDKKLDSQEILKAFKALEQQLASANSGTIAFANFPPNIQSQLREFDETGDEKLDAQEVLKGVQALAREKQKSKFLMMVAGGLLVFSLILLACMMGLMFAVIEVTKESKVESTGVMRVKGSDTAIQVASTDTVIVDGVLVTRTASQSGARRQGCATVNGTCPPNSVGTSEHRVPAPLSSTMPDADLKELKSMTVSQGKSWVSFQIHSVGRYETMEGESRHGSVVVLYTHIGQLTLDGEAVFFEESVHGAFSAAGFEVEVGFDNRRRRLLGVVDVLGLFNVLNEAAGGSDDVPSPLIPSQFVAEVKKITYCEGSDCNRPDGRLCDHVLPMNDGRDAIIAHEDQVLMEVNSKYLSRTDIKKLQYPGQVLSKVRNESHLLEYISYDGVPYHCHLVRDGELGEQVRLFDSTERRSLSDFQKFFTPLLDDKLRKPRKTVRRSANKRRSMDPSFRPAGSSPEFGPPVMSGAAPLDGDFGYGSGYGSGSGFGDMPSWEYETNYYYGLDPYGSGGPLGGSGAGASGLGDYFTADSGGGPPIDPTNDYYDPDLAAGFGIDPSPPPQPPPVEYATEFLGFDSVDGVYCKKFEIVAYRDGKKLIYTFWEHYAERRIYQAAVGNVAYRFLSMEALTDDNKPPMEDMDIGHILNNCDPMGILAPPEWEEAALDTVYPPMDDPEETWGMPIVYDEADAYANFSMYFLEEYIEAFGNESIQLINQSYTTRAQPEVKRMSSEEWLRSRKPSISKKDHDEHKLRQARGEAVRAMNPMDICTSVYESEEIQFLQVTTIHTVNCSDPMDWKSREVILEPLPYAMDCPSVHGSAYYRESIGAEGWAILEVAGDLTITMDIQSCLWDRLPEMLKELLDFYADGQQTYATVHVSPYYSPYYSMEEDVYGNSEIGTIQWNPEFFGRAEWQVEFLQDPASYPEDPYSGFGEGSGFDSGAGSGSGFAGGSGFLAPVGSGSEFNGPVGVGVADQSNPKMEGVIVTPRFEVQINPLLYCGRLQKRGSPMKIGIRADLVIEMDWYASEESGMSDEHHEYHINLFPDPITYGAPMNAEVQGVYPYVVDTPGHPHTLGFVDMPHGAQCICPPWSWGGEGGWWSRCAFDIEEDIPPMTTPLPMTGNSTR